MSDSNSEQLNPLVAGFHSRGALPHLKREGGTYFVAFRQAGSLPKEALLRFKQERDAILAQAEAAKRPLTWHEQGGVVPVVFASCGQISQAGRLPHVA
jgi:hypothetical protein